MLTQIVSGGQTGVDRAALDAAQATGFPTGGWCPKGRKTEAGPLPPQYPLRETPSAAYTQRTQWNVRDSDGTLIVSRGPLRGGTALTLETAQRLQKPVLHLNLDGDQDLNGIRSWIQTHRIQVLNVAGPRESETPGIYAETLHLLSQLLTHHGKKKQGISDNKTN